MARSRAASERLSMASPAVRIGPIVVVTDSQISPGRRVVGVEAYSSLQHGDGIFVGERIVRQRDYCGDRDRRLLRSWDACRLSPESVPTPRAGTNPCRTFAVIWFRMAIRSGAATVMVSRQNGAVVRDVHGLESDFQSGRLVSCSVR